MTVADTAGEPAVPCALIDTNVLLAATDVARRAHDAALHLLDHDRRALVVTPQIVREFLAVATRPIELNGLGLTGSDAAANLGELLEVLDVVDEDLDSVDRLTVMVSSGVAAGKQVHDANVVAVALARSIDAIVTDNVRHFARFSEMITIEPLAPQEESP